MQDAVQCSANSEGEGRGGEEIDMSCEIIIESAVIFISHQVISFDQALHALLDELTNSKNDKK